MIQKWCFDVEIDISGSKKVNPKIRWGRESQDSSLALKPSGPSKSGVGRFGASAPRQLQGCQMSKHPTGYQ
jgi:hypothetical protein